MDSHHVNFFTIMPLKVSRSCRMDFAAWKMQNENVDSSWTITIRDNFCLTHVTANDHPCKHLRAFIFFTVNLLNMTKLLYLIVKYLFDACRWETLLGNSVSYYWVGSTDFVGTPHRIFKMIQKALMLSSTAKAEMCMIFYCPVNVNGVEFSVFAPIALSVIVIFLIMMTSSVWLLLFL